MSRIGQSPISFSDEVEVSLDEKNLKVKGPKCELFLEISKKINVDIDNKVIKIVNNDNSKQGKAVWGTTRSLVNNMVVGVTKGFSKNMEIGIITTDSNVIQNYNYFIEKLKIDSLFNSIKELELI